MKSSTEYKISKSDVRRYPPYVSHFLLVIGLMYISHGLSLTVAGLYFFQLSPLPLLLMVVPTILLVVYFNIRLVRGHLTAQKGLKFLCAVYFVISTTALIDINQQGIPPVLAVITLSTSSLAWLIIKGKRYQIMANHMARIWAFYRETGTTVLAEVTRQEREEKMSIGPSASKKRK